MGMKRIWIAAGGTGGHVFPGLVLAEALQAQGCSVVWLGTQAGLEARLVPAAGIPLFTMTARPLRGQGVLGLLRGLMGMLYALLMVMKLACQSRPDLVLSMGGYVAAPVGLVAKLLNIPLVLHEQNAVAGSTNRVLARWSQKIFTAFPDAFLPALVVQRTGNPVRNDILTLGQNKKPPTDRPLNCLILGGSQGASVLNQYVFAAWSGLPEVARPHLWHQVGHADVATYTDQYEKHSTQVRVDAFIEHMAEAYAWADVVIARAGAMTVSECLAAALPSAWVPYPWATDQHQTANAEFFIQISQGWVWPQADLNTAQIVQWWADCAKHLAQYQAQALQAAQGQPVATSEIVRGCFAVMSRHQGA